MSRHIGLKSSVKSAKLEAYCRRLADILAKSKDAYLRPEDIERCITQVNRQVRFLSTLILVLS